MSADAYVMPPAPASAETLAEVTRQRDEAVAVLREVVDEFGCTLEQYHRIGPDFTHRDGTEVFTVSVILDREDLINRARAVLSRAEARP